MKISINCPVSLTTAPAGWWVKHSSPDGDTWNSRIVAWAVVSAGFDEDGSMDTTIEPAFLHDGTLWTRSEWYAAMGPENGIEVVEP
ncbi:hypothetical protein AB0H94_21140 [Streptomyces purpurascens]|uniref:hypothetical protein n=1 Tax=Streptomyces purpurascens TaxID=1924 RepID=UPI0033FA0766